MAKILVVDDEKLIVKGLRFSLMQDGYQVDTAYDGEEALAKAKGNDYDIILLDVMLPKMDGFEVCQQIRFDDTSAGTYILPLPKVKKTLPAAAHIRLQIKAHRADKNQYSENTLFQPHGY